VVTLPIKILGALYKLTSNLTNILGQGYKIIKVIIMISTLYYLFKIGALDNIVSILKKRLNDRREFKFYKENFMNKGYKKFEVGEDLNLPFNIYIPKQEKYKIYMPRWMKMLLINCKFLYPLVVKLSLKKLDDPILNNEDKKLINSILEELENIDI
jgi:hypothetical protein